ncbi:GntR family transcriptional regulator [Aeromicrobium sp. CF3.5]|uniref:GntR family transcriptional regulator n=1 Tax=Aeromicrobium sp. CF3.5 TaxID=3373078 RepID=UPI003EE56D7B
MSESLQISVDRSSPVPLYFQVAEQIERAISDGRLSPGQKIDNEVAFATELGLSRPTMRQAIQTLVDKGMLVRKRGVGTQVVRSEIRRSVELTSLYDDLARAGEQQHTDVLGLARGPADEDVAAALQIAAGDEVWCLRRLRWVKEQPLAIMTNHLPAAMVDLSSIDFTRVGLYGELRRLGIHLRVAHQRIGARPADQAEGRLLAQRKGAPLLTMSRTAFNDAGVAIEHGSHAYRPDLYAFEVTLVDR